MFLIILYILGDSDKGDLESEKGSIKSTILQKFSPKLIKTILELLCDESVRV